MAYTIAFPDTSHNPVRLSEGTNLAQELTVLNSPLLFGCRTGICGTCLVQIENGYETLKAPDSDEKEALEIYATGNMNARLACQIFLNCDLTLRKIESV